MNRRLGQPAINIYTDKDTGKPKGDATLSYEEPICAKAAVEHFDGTSQQCESPKVKASAAMMKTLFILKGTLGCRSSLVI